MLWGVCASEEDMQIIYFSSTVNETCVNMFVNYHDMIDLFSIQRSFNRSKRINKDRKNIFDRCMYMLLIANVFLFKKASNKKACMNRRSWKKTYDRRAESSVFIFINRERDIYRVDWIKERKCELKTDTVNQLAISHCICVCTCTCKLHVV